MSMLLVLCLLTVVRCQEVQKECLSRDYGNGGTVCVCTPTHCDTLPPPKKTQKPNYLMYTSNKAGLRFEKKLGKFNTSAQKIKHITINSQKKYQKIIGFGGAFTDASGININSLPNILQNQLLRSYFSDDGIEYNLGRVPMGSSDCSTRAYSYNDGEVDKNLTNFALAEEDFKFKIPYIKTAKQLNNRLQLLTSVWTAPKWMKTNGEYAGFGFLKKEMYQTWANYFVKFLDEYRKNEVVFWGISTGNEPMTVWYPIARDVINCVGWLPRDLRDWIEHNLGPTIRKSTHSSIKIIAFEDNRIYFPFYVDFFLTNSTEKFVDGFGLHWYLDFIPPVLVTKTHDQFPDKFILATEGSYITLGPNPVLLGSWKRGESYSSDIIQDLNNWVGGWVDWNMVLDLDGGPNYVKNFLDAPIIANATGGEFYKQPMFYHLGHFSKFVPRGSVRIDSSTSWVSEVINNLKVVAFRRPDNGTAVIILNKSNEVVKVSVTDDSRGTAEVELSERSMNTMLYW